MKKLAASLLTVLCATALATAQDFSQTSEWEDVQPAATTPAVETPAPVYNEPQATQPVAQPVATTTQTEAAPVENNESMPIDAEPTFAKKKQTIGFGARASFIYGNFWGFKDLDDLDAPDGFGADFGVAARFTITDGLLFTPELAFRLLYLEHGDEDYTRNFDMMFLDFAFYIRGAITKAFYLEVGPQISINTSSDYTIESESGAYDTFENIEQSAVELGINIGLGYYIMENLSVGFRWYMGFNEVFPDVKYLDELTANDYEGSKIKHGVKCSFSNLKGAHTMMFKLGVTYWFI